LSAILNKVKVLEPENPNKSTALFGGKASGILNWNDLAYPHFYDYREQIRALFWRASEVDMTHDIKQFPQLSAAEQEAFFENYWLIGYIGRTANRYCDADCRFCHRSIGKINYGNDRRPRK